MSDFGFRGCSPVDERVCRGGWVEMGVYVWEAREEGGVDEIDDCDHA